jgi:hypothetical protein
MSHHQGQLVRRAPRQLLGSHVVPESLSLAPLELLHVPLVSSGADADAAALMTSGARLFRQELHPEQLVGRAIDGQLERFPRLIPHGSNDLAGRVGRLAERW